MIDWTGRRVLMVPPPHPTMPQFFDEIYLSQQFKEALWILLNPESLAEEYADDS